MDYPHIKKLLIYSNSQECATNYKTLLSLITSNMPDEVKDVVTSTETIYSLKNHIKTNTTQFGMYFTDLSLYYNTKIVFTLLTFEPKISYVAALSTSYLNVAIELLYNITCFIESSNQCILEEHIVLSLIVAYVSKLTLKYAEDLPISLVKRNLSFFFRVVCKFLLSIDFSFIANEINDLYFHSLTFSLKKIMSLYEYYKEEFVEAGGLVHSLVWLKKSFVKGQRLNRLYELRVLSFLDEITRHECIIPFKKQIMKVMITYCEKLITDTKLMSYELKKTNGQKPGSMEFIMACGILNNMLDSIPDMKKELMKYLHETGVLNLFDKLILHLDKNSWVSKVCISLVLQLVDVDTDLIK